MNYKVMEALGTASTVAPGVIDMPYMRDGGFFDVAGATIQHNWDQSVGGLKNNLDPDYDFEPDKETLAQGLSEDSAGSSRTATTTAGEKPSVSGAT